MIEGADICTSSTALETKSYTVHIQVQHKTGLERWPRLVGANISVIVFILFVVICTAGEQLSCSIIVIPWHSADTEALTPSGWGKQKSTRVCFYPRMEQTLLLIWSKLYYPSTHRSDAPYWCEEVRLWQHCTLSDWIVMLIICILIIILIFQRQNQLVII